MTCIITGCKEPIKAKDRCQRHYDRLRNGTEGKPEKLPPISETFCRFRDCNRPIVTRKLVLCNAHYAQWLRGVPLSPIRDKKGRPSTGGHITREGYRKIWVNHKQVLEHRYVMEQHLGRKLLKNEEVHHINGNRSDNQLGNLELWSTSHPSGQRVQDKVAWAIELLQLYAPEKLT